MEKDIETEWDGDRYRDFLARFIALQIALDSLSGHPMFSRSGGEWRCDVRRRFPKETEELISAFAHLEFTDRVLPTTGYFDRHGAFLSFDGNRMDIRSDRSPSSLVERVLLKFVSDQLFRIGNANYGREHFCPSLELFKSMGGSDWSGRQLCDDGLTVDQRERLASGSWLPRVGFASDREPVVEYRTVRPYGFPGIYFRRAVFNSRRPFGIEVSESDVIAFPRDGGVCSES